MKKEHLALALVILAAAGAALLYEATQVETNDLQVVPVGAPFYLDAAQSPPKLVFISDIHYATYRPQYWEKAKNLINAQNPDFILIGGDVVNSGAEEDIARLEKLNELRAAKGIYAVLGNHDYNVWGCPAMPESLQYAQRVQQKLESMGIKVLRNEKVMVDEGKSSQFAIVGLDDANVCRQDYAKATEGLDASVPRVVLMHEPAAIYAGAQEVADDAQMAAPAQTGRATRLAGTNLVLSGHTHCGLVYVPYLTNAILAMFGFGWDAGGKVDLKNGNEQYISCGLTPGVVRLNTKPEIAVIKLGQK